MPRLVGFSRFAALLEEQISEKISRRSPGAFCSKRRPVLARLGRAQASQRRGSGHNHRDVCRDAEGRGDSGPGRLDVRVHAVQAEREGRTEPPHREHAEPAP